MSMREIVKDSTNQSVVVRIIDSTTGLPEQAVEHDTAGIAMWYRREGATKQTVATAALAALDTAHTDGGIEHIDDGYYRFDLPDAAVATGVDGVMVGGAVTDMIVMGTYVPLINAAYVAAPTAVENRQEMDNNSTELAKIGAIPTTAMRGTDNAALASVATEGRLAELDAANLPTDIAAIPTTAMRGTDGANTTVPDAAGTAAGLHTTTDGKIDTVEGKIDAIPTTAMRGTDGANTTVPDAAGTAAGLHSTTDGLISALPLPEAPAKNVAFSNLEFLMVDETDHATPETGLTVTGQVSKDGAAFGDIAGSIAEVSNGIYSCDAAQADMNADILTFRFSATGADDTFVTIKTSS